MIEFDDIEHLTDAEVKRLIYDWSLWARPSQLSPDNPSSSNYIPPSHAHHGTAQWEIWLALAGRGWGKALAIDTLIPTPQGLTPLSHINTGDLVYAPDGTATRVLQAHPTQLNRPCYLVTFDNGQSVVADEEHLWATIPREQRRRPKEVFKAIHTTLEISQSLRVGSTANHFIPSALPLTQPHVTLTIPPYLLGYWLGDGSSRGWRFTVLKEDLSHFQSKLPPDIRLSYKQDKSPSCWDVTLSNQAPSVRSPLTGLYQSNDSLQSQLKYLGLYKNKHIPGIYLNSSIEQRLELLRGLMDSDGTVSKKGNQCSYYSTSKILADQTYQLISSLGYVVSRSIRQPKITGKPEAVCKPCHVLRIRPRTEMNPFSLPRKRDRVAPLSHTQSSRLGGRFIISVTPVPSVPVRCLTVEHPSKLYLITPDCIPTHNTRSGAEQVLRWVKQGYSRIAIIAPTTSDTRDVVTEGESGIMSIAPPSIRPNYEPSKRRLTFPNGAIATLYSAEEPERLRGPQHMAIWMDEMAAWSRPQETWDQAMFGLRLGRLPQVYISTTPKPIPLIRDLIARSRTTPHKVVLTTGSTYENAENLASTFFQAVAQYEGTRLGRQELHAEIIDPAESGIISLPWLKKYPHTSPLPKFEFILQSYDTAFTEKTMDSKTKDPDPSACITFGVYRNQNPPYQYKVLVLDCWTDHLSYPDLRAKALKEYSYSYGPSPDERKPDVILIEDKGSGISLRQELQRAGLPVRPYNPGRADKVQRLHAVSHIPAHYLVEIPESQSIPDSFISWSLPMIDQITTFPQTVHDDLVDAFSQGLLYLSDSGWLTVDPPDLDPEEKDYSSSLENPYSA